MIQESSTLLFVMCLAPVFIFFMGAGLLAAFKKTMKLRSK
jgi:hypothetical protein